MISSFLACSRSSRRLRASRVFERRASAWSLYRGEKSVNVRPGTLHLHNFSAADLNLDPGFRTLQASEPLKTAVSVRKPYTQIAGNQNTEHWLITRTDTFTERSRLGPKLQGNKSLKESQTSHQKWSKTTRFLLILMIADSQENISNVWYLLCTEIVTHLYRIILKTNTTRLCTKRCALVIYNSLLQAELHQGSSPTRLVLFGQKGTNILCALGRVVPLTREASCGLCQPSACGCAPWGCACSWTHYLWPSGTGCGTCTQATHLQSVNKYVKWLLKVVSFT